MKLLNQKVEEQIVITTPVAIMLIKVADLLSDL